MFVAVAIGTIMPSKAEARVAVSAASTAARSSAVVRSSSSTAAMSSSTNMALMTVAVVAASSGSSGASAREVTADVPMLTACTAQQFETARAWQDDCRELDSVSSRYCAALSYQRHCDAITPAEAQGLAPARDGYRNTYLREGAR